MLIHSCVFQNRETQVEKSKPGCGRRIDTHLAGVLSALQEAQAEHVASDLVGVGALASGIREDGCIQTLQERRHAGCGRQE